MITSVVEEFRREVAALPRNEILNLIKKQSPELFKQVKRIEWVFANKLRHIGINGKQFSNEELAYILDPPFKEDPFLTKAGFNLLQQKSIHIASDPILWAKEFLAAEPRVFQILILRDPSLRKVLRLGRRMGKALDVQTPIPTPDGWKTMGELKEGDRVFDENGKPCDVTFVTDYQYDRNCFEIVFSDGSTIVADEDHLWNVYSKLDRKKMGRTNTRPDSYPAQTLTTAQIKNSLYHNKEINYSIPIAKPIEYEQRSLPIDPWVFGFWLGDGTSTSGDITIGYQDQSFILNKISQQGYEYNSRKDVLCFNIKGLSSLLNDLGVRRHPKHNKRSEGCISKFIPREYLESSIEQREELLKGLMDSDGSVVLSNGTCEFSNSNKRLAEDVLELIKSLGYRATLKAGTASLNGNDCGFRYRIAWTPNRAVFSLPRKLMKQVIKSDLSAKTKWRYIVDVRPVESRPVKCISVNSPNNLYLAGESFIPTHNTWSLAVLLLHYAYTTQNGKCLVMAPAKTQVGLIFDQIMEFVQSGTLGKTVTRSVRSPQYEIDLSNGASIRLFTTGIASGGKSDIARGQEAGLIVLDEMDYMGAEDTDALYAMLLRTAENQPDKMLVAASTPTGRREKFWHWATQDSRFKEFYFPSYVSPLWDKETEEDQRNHYTSNAYRREIEADWGEDADGVYPRKYVDLAFKTPGWKYAPRRQLPDAIYLMGVDWDKYGAGPNIVVLELQPGNTQLKLVFREEIPKDDYVFIKAVQRIIQLNDSFDPTFIYVDAGSGEMQYEALMKHGVDNPHTRLKDKVKRISFAQTIEVRDPFTKQPIKKEVKPFMVDNMRMLLENEEIIFPSQDDELYMQFISYVVLRITPTGRPIFEASGTQADHAHDALILACLAYTQNYGELFKLKYARISKSVSTNILNPIDVSKDAPDSGKKAPIKRTGAWRSHGGSNSRISRRSF